MSYFIKLPYDQVTMDDTQYAFPIDASSYANIRIDSMPTEDGELDDNENLGFIMRFHVYAISTTPIRHALYTQKYGFGQWLSYKSATGTLGLSSTIGSNETFLVSPVSLVSVERQIVLVSPQLYFQSTYVTSTQNSLNAVTTQNDRCNFGWQHEVGTGPLMPGMAYYIRTLYSKALSCPVSTATVWTQSTATSNYGVTEQVAFQAVKVLGVSGATYYSYNVITNWGKYVSVSSTGVISFKSTSTTPGATEEFRLLKSEFAFGKFRLMCVANSFCIRANSDGFQVGTIDVSYEAPQDYLDFIPAYNGPAFTCENAHERALAIAAPMTLPAVAFEEGFDPATLVMFGEQPEASAPRSKSYAGAIEIEEDGRHASVANSHIRVSRRAALLFLVAAIAGLMVFLAQMYVAHAHQ